MLHDLLADRRLRYVRTSKYLLLLINLRCLALVRTYTIQT